MVHETEVDVATIAGSDAGDGGVAYGALLTGFVEAIQNRDAETLEQARSRVVDAMGAEAMIDAAAVCANFHMMTRIADATGTPLDEMSDAPSEQLRADLGLDALVSARRSVGPG
ncbi:MAG TPA: hypothetical protein VFW06_03805 [Acidimicrobiia bacterium]|nr:hypothetical protein [Acidimicrobiia bacterium]